MHHDVLRLTTGRYSQNTALIDRSGIGAAVAQYIKTPAIFQ